MEQEKMIKIVIEIFIVINTIALLILANTLSSNTREKNEAIVNGALEDMSLNRSDFKIIELKIFEGTNVFVLRLDEKLLLGSFDEKEDGIICGTKQEISDIYEWGCEIVFKKKYTKCTLKDCSQLQKFYRLNKPPQSWCYVEKLEVEE